MVGELLDASRVAAGRLTLVRKRVDVLSAVSTLVDRLRLTLGAHRLELDTSHAPEHVHMWVDPSRLDTILTNLIENVATVSGDGARIRLALGAGEDGGPQGLVLTVSAQGIGIAPEELRDLFDRFPHAEGAAGTKTGLGLSLYITKGLVEAHGGKIWLGSTPRGNTFHVWFPCEKPAAAEDHDEAPTLH
jgi:signal transduction histidine kinase